MRRILAGLMLALLSSIPARAQAPAPGAYAEHFARQCAACHGADGAGQPGVAPALAGQHSFYTVTQLFLFKNGRRDNEAMAPFSKNFSNDDLRGYSDYLASLPAWPVQAAAIESDAGRMSAGKALADGHQCFSCHGKALAGDKQVPRLAGQHEDYLLRSLQGFRSGKRLGYTPAMNEALAGLSGEELASLAYFIARYRPAP